MADYVNDLKLLVVLFFLAGGFVVSGSILTLVYLAYRKMRRGHRTRGRRVRK